MAVIIRLSRYGVRKKPFYRMVVAERLGSRDGKFLEALGTYDPRTVPPKIVLKEDRVKRWIAVGAKPSLMVRAIIEKIIPGLVKNREANKRAKIVARRKARKQRLLAKAKPASKKTKK